MKRWGIKVSGDWLIEEVFQKKDGTLDYKHCIYDKRREAVAETVWLNGKPFKRKDKYTVEEYK